MKNNCIFIGYMGCGKTTIGRKVADVLNRKFVDTDALIEERQRMTISKIFETKGEKYFRNLETQVLQDLLKDDEERVISVGGGLPIREENQELLQKLGCVIYLQAEPDTIYNRIKGDTTRPLLQTEDPRAKIEEMLKSREEKYLAAADRVLCVDEKQIAEIVDEILTIIKKC